MCVVVDGYKIANVYKSPPIPLQVSDLPVFPHPCLYAGDFNCQHVDWCYDANSADGECLVGWANTNNLALLHKPKGSRKLLLWPLEYKYQPGTCIRQYRFGQSFARPVPSKPVKRWNFPKAKWSHYITLTNKLARILPPPDLSDIDQEYQCFCNAISTAAKKCILHGRRNNRVPYWDAECENLCQTFLH